MTFEIGFEIGDWVVLMDCDLVSPDNEPSTWHGLPCIVSGLIGKKRVKLESPLKVYHGRPPYDEAPVSQLIRITENEGLRYCKRIFQQDKECRFSQLCS